MYWVRSRWAKKKRRPRTYLHTQTDHNTHTHIQTRNVSIIVLKAYLGKLSSWTYHQFQIAPHMSEAYVHKWIKKETHLNHWTLLTIPQSITDGIIIVVIVVVFVVEPKKKTAENGWFIIDSTSLILFHTCRKISVQCVSLQWMSENKAHKWK